MKKLIPFLLLFLSYSALAQVGINATGTAPAPSAMLDVSSTNKGVLVPRMNAVQKGNIPNKVEGLMVYDTDAHQFSYWTGSVWVNFGTTASIAGWVTSGNNIYNANTGNVGIGTTAPKEKLEINSGSYYKLGIRLTQTEGGINPASTIATITSPTSIAKDYNGNLYVTNYSGNKIHKITSGVVSDFVTVGLNGPQFIVFGPDGNLYVSNFNSGSVLKITLAGVQSTFGSGYLSPAGLTFDTAGNLYVANTNPGTISKVNASGTVISHTFATGLSSPYGCVFDPLTDKIYIVDLGAYEVAQVNATTGGAKSTFYGGQTNLGGITRNRYGEIFVSYTNGSISKLNSSYSSFYASADHPAGILMDSEDNLFVANYLGFAASGAVSKISPNLLSSILGTTPFGEIKPIRLSQNGYKIYLNNEISSYDKGIYCEVSPGSIAGQFVGNVYVNGLLTATSTSFPSDARLKRDFSPLTSSLSNINKLNGYHYYWKDESRIKGLQTGLIAQEVQKIFPELVNTDKEGMLSVDYIGLIPHLIEAIKELKIKNQELENSLEKRLNILEANSSPSKDNNKPKISDK